MNKDFSYLDDREDFVNAVAIDCITKMNDEKKLTLLNNPDARLYHHSYGMWIRNTYIYPYKLHFFEFMADSLSHSIIEEVIILLQEAL